MMTSTTSPNNKRAKSEPLQTPLIVDIGDRIAAVKLLLTTIRSKHSPRVDFVRAIDRLSTILAEEGLARFFTKPMSVITPTDTPYEGLTLLADPSEALCVVSILRSGDIIAEAVRKLIPEVVVGKILIQRLEEHPEKPAVLHYTKFPKDIALRRVVVCDPMCGTGGSVVCCLDELVKAGVKPENVLFLNLISAPEGLARMHAKYPQVLVVTCAVDEGMNSNRYIVPGLGDAGDRYFGTPSE